MADLPLQDVEVFNFLNPDFAPPFGDTEDLQDPSSPSLSSETPPSSPDAPLFGFNNDDMELYDISSFLKDDTINIGPSFFDTVPLLTKDEEFSIQSAMAPAMEPASTIIEDIYIKQDPQAEEESTSTSSNAKKRGRKRRKTNTEEAVEVPKEEEDSQLTNVVPPITSADGKLNRDQLLTLSSKAFEEYAKRLTATRELTADEKKELKKQRRLIKNRESAQASRQRKKSYIEKLEQKVQSLATTNATLKQQITSLQSENNSLKEEVVYLQNVIKKTPGLSTLFNTGINYVASLAKQQQHQPNLQNNVRAAGVCLLILLFSFGLFFPQAAQQSSGASQPALPFDTSREPIPEVLPSTTRIFKGNDYKLASTSRSLTSVLSEQDFNTKRIEKAYQQRLQKHTKKEDEANQPTSQQAKVNTCTEENDNTPITQQVQDLRRSKRKRDEITSTNNVGSQTPVPVQTTPQQVNATQIPNLAPQISQWKPNTTYLMCNNVQHIQPPSSAQIQSDANAPLLLSFLIPQDTLRGTNGTDSASDELLEVTCQVLDINLLPLLASASPAAKGRAVSTVESPA